MAKSIRPLELNEDSTLIKKDKSEPEINENEDDEYDEEEDDDYDPTAKEQDQAENESDEEDVGIKEVDYSAIETGYSQVKTRNQLKQDKYGSKSGNKGAHGTGGLIKDSSTVSNIDEIFNELKTKKQGTPDDWLAIIGKEPEEPPEKSTKRPATPPEHELLVENKKIKISTSYTFAGKVVTDTKYVDADSAEAKAYLNSTSAIAKSSELKPGSGRSFVPIIRELPGTKEVLELRIKLKRPSLIDKFLATQGNKNQKLSTLEKSRLDWASFVDESKIQDELKIGNRAGYLEKQDFLGRLEVKRDEQYQRAKEEDKAQRWRLSQQQM